MYTNQQHESASDFETARKLLSQRPLGLLEIGAFVQILGWRDRVIQMHKCGAMPLDQYLNMVAEINRELRHILGI